MIEIIIDDSRLQTRNENQSDLAHKNNYNLRIQDASLCKMSLLSFIKKHSYLFDLEERQYIFIKPCKTSERFIYDLHAVTNSELKILLKRHLKLR
jgi:hypothetical protein